MVKDAGLVCLFSNPSHIQQLQALLLLAAYFGANRYFLSSLLGPLDYSTSLSRYIAEYSVIRKRSRPSASSA